MTTLDDMSREAGWYDRRYTAMKAEIEELRSQLSELREQARMAGIWATLDPKERENLLSWEQRDYADAAEWCAALQEAGDE